MSRTDEVLEAIDQATRDASIGPDAMRWSPDPPAPSPSGRAAAGPLNQGVLLHHVVVEFHYADGLIQRAVAHHPGHTEVSVDTADEPENWFGARATVSRLRHNLSLTLEDIHRIEVTTATSVPPRM